MRHILFLFLITILFTSACKDKDSVTDVKLNFKANYDGELLLLEKEYMYIGNIPIKFSQFNFYVANISLIKQNGSSNEETELVDIDFVDFPYNLNQADQAQSGQTIHINDVPVGEYDGIKIGFGVPAGFNSTRTNDYNSSHPLSMASHYWDGWSSYIFSKIEGKADMDLDGTFETNDGEGLTYHMGTDEVYTTKTMFQNIKVKENETMELQLDIDVKKLFLMPVAEYDGDGDGYLDIEDYDNAHASDRIEMSKQIMNNYAEAVGF